MMDAKEWMKENLEKICNEFYRISTRYVYDDLSNTHFVLLFPDTILEDAAYLKAETKLRIEFIKQFTFECLCFLTENDTVFLENMEVIYERLPLAVKK